MYSAIVFVLSVLFSPLLAAPQIFPRINGGSEAKIEEFPFIASLREVNGNQNKHLCGAVIVSKTHLLTAAQCIHSQQLDWFRIVVGTNIKNDQTQPIKTIKKIIIHEEYDGFTAPFKNDIAIIELDQPLTFSDRVNVITMNTTLYDGQLDAVTLGFGGVYDKLTRLQSLSVQTMSNVDCRKKVNKNPIVYDFSTICAYSGDPKRRIGHGDAGGPLIYQKSLIGLIAWNPQVVGSEKPEGFTRLSSFKAWIAKHIK